MEALIELNTNTKRANYFVRSLVFGLVLSLATIWIVYILRVQAEGNALNFVRRNGFTSEGYIHNSWSSYVAREYPPPKEGSFPYLVDRMIGVSFPRDRMTDEMASHLINIHNLDAIQLYPPDPDSIGFDGSATVMQRVSRLSDIDLPLSAVSIRKLEARFPNLEVWTADQPELVNETAGIASSKD